MKNIRFDKQKILTTAVTVLLVFFFAGGFLIGLDRVSSMEGTLVPNDIVEGISPAPASVEEAVGLLDKVVYKALESDASVDFRRSFSFDDNSLVTDGSESFRTSLMFAKDNFISHITSAETSDTEIDHVGFDGDVGTLLRVPSFDNIEVSDFSCNYIYYRCPSCGENSDILKDSCELCGSERAYYKKYKNEYEIVLYFSEDISEVYPDAFEHNFTPRSEDAIKMLTADVIKDSIEINKTEISYNGFRIVYKVNRLTDELTYLSYIKDFSVDSEVSFIGEFAEIGQKSISFAMTENNYFNLTWPSIELNENSIVIEPGKSDNLLATLVCENPLDMVVTWTSDNEDIATVDDEGYIYTTKNTGDATITATYEYLGKTYSDSCIVHVRIPVESMKISDKKLQLRIGETATLETKVSPSKATVKSVTWYSEDESIATVDADGVVTPVSVGNVIIYALSDDGYYRSTCEVSVNE